LSLRIFTALAFVSLFPLIALSVRAEELYIYFKTTPRLELLRPFDDPVDLSLLITGADGRPVEQGTVDIRLDAPKPGRFFSTDFPLVEGAPLSEMRLRLRQGRTAWKSLLPIRGEYRLAVDVLTNDGRKASKTFTFKVHESRVKWLALSGFSLGLFALGFIAGRLFTGKSTGVALLATVFLSVFPPVVGAQEDKPAAVLEIEPASVGRLSVVRWYLANVALSDKPNALLTLTIKHLEKDKIAFAVERLPVAGDFLLKFHFPDGARYRVSANAQLVGGSLIRNEQVVEVTGVEPPAGAMVPALALFVAIIALGLGVGRWSKRRSSVCRKK
jgi:hypothetical protein